MKKLTTQEVLDNVRFTNKFYHPWKDSCDFENSNCQDLEVLRYGKVDYVEISNKDGIVGFVSLKKYKRGVSTPEWYAHIDDLMELTDCGYGFLETKERD